MDKEKVTKRSGYVYNKNTKARFQRMRRLGIVMPPFRVEDNVTKLLTTHYDRLLKKLAQATRGAIALEKSVNDSVYSEIVGQLQDAIIQGITSDKIKLAQLLSAQFNASRKHFFEDFIEDADESISIQIQYALDKDDVFQQRIEGLHKYYLDNAIERITGEEDFLKSVFLQEFTKYTMGESKDLISLSDVMKAMKKTAVSDARFFARDQFARFNKAMTLASFDQSGVDSVQWIPVGDQRTRKTHTTQSIKAKYGSDIFKAGNLPSEKDDYLCRCGLIPIFKD